VYGQKKTRGNVLGFGEEGRGVEGERGWLGGKDDVEGRKGGVEKGVYMQIQRNERRNRDPEQRPGTWGAKGWQTGQK